MLQAFLTRKVLSALIGSLLTALAGVLSAHGVTVGAETLDLWKEAILGALGVALSLYGGTEGRQPAEIE